MKNLNSKGVNILMGKIYYFDKNLYGQIKDLLVEYRNVLSMLEEASDTTVKAYLTQKKGVLLNELLRNGIRWDYPDYPKMEQETID